MALLPLFHRHCSTSMMKRFSPVLNLLVIVAFTVVVNAQRNGVDNVGELLERQKAFKGAPMGDFDFYVLAQTWTPGFCCKKKHLEQCRMVRGEYGEENMVLHGLWPQYSQERYENEGFRWPEWCAQYIDCERGRKPSFCKQPSSLLNRYSAQFFSLAPGYVGDKFFLAHHEYAKHGSCANLTASKYYDHSLAVQRMMTTPSAVRHNIGRLMPYKDLLNAYGGKNMVGLQCDRNNGTLIGVTSCFASDPYDFSPGRRIPCPKILTDDNYTNGCKQFDRVFINPLGQCALP